MSRTAPRSYEMLQVPPREGAHDHLDPSNMSPSCKKRGSEREICFGMSNLDYSCVARRAERIMKTA